MTDIAKIAEGLTEAMRDCLVQHDGRDATAYMLARWAGYPPQGKYMAAEARKSGFFAIRKGINGLLLYPLNDLGLAVRAHLEGER